MKNLQPNWLTEGLIDFEYKKYVLLSYIKDVNIAFDKKLLYPIFSNLLFHYNNLIKLKENKTLLNENFPKELSGLDIKNLRILYNELIKDDEVMKELEEIMNYSIPIFKNQVSLGKELYEEVEHNLSITPIGIMPIKQEFGYLFFTIEQANVANIYEYELTIFESSTEKYRGMHTKYLETVTKNVNMTYEYLKGNLIKKYQKMVNPSTFLIQSKINYPMEEAIIPVAKRLLVRNLIIT